MKNSVRGILALVVGLFAGSLINMGLITLGNSIVPLPTGADTTTTVGLRQAITMFGPEHFVFPWLGHAVGTFMGVLIATLIQRSNAMIIPIIITIAYLIGGIMMVVQIPSPLWFDVVDLAGAYLPMGYLGYRFGKR